MVDIISSDHYKIGKEKNDLVHYINEKSLLLKVFSLAASKNGKNNFCNKCRFTMIQVI